MARRLWGAAYTVTAAILQLIIFKGNIYLFSIFQNFVLKAKIEKCFHPLVYFAPRELNSQANQAKTMKNLPQINAEGKICFR